MYGIGKVLYSQIHSLLPREAVMVTLLKERLFSNYNEALEYCRGLRVSGDYTYAPVEIPDSLLERKGRRRTVGRR